MTTIPTFSKDGKKSGTIAVPKVLSETKSSRVLLHQVVTGLLSNMHRETAHTKTRGEVRGGGRKPWRQKGTGRARAGSIRSPLWRGGGTTFGPRNTRNFAVRMPHTARRMAFRQVLAEKIRHGEVFVVTSLELAKPKTKIVEALLQRLPLREGRILLIIEELSPELSRATNNLPYLTLRTHLTTNVLDLLVADSVVLTKQAFTALEQRYAAS